MQAETNRTVLALDAATEGCSAAVVVGDEPRASRFERLQRGHAERLMPMIEAVMQEARLDYGALGAIAATVGPGSFTGVRVGLAAARGLALASGVTLIGVTTLEALAAAVPGAERRSCTRILAALDASRGQVYAQWFDAAGLALAPPFAATASDVIERFDPVGAVVVGSGAAAILAALGTRGEAIRISSAPEWPEAVTIGRLVAARARQAGGFDGLATGVVQPLYLREPGITPAGRASMAGRS